MNTGNSVSLHRVIRAAPEKLFKAFSSGTAYASWIPPYGFICEVEKFDFRKGGEFRMSFINFTTGKAESFGGSILEVKENEYIRFFDQFDDPDMPGKVTTTVRLEKVIGGTDLRILQEGIPEAIPVEMCYLGWQDSLDKLSRLVEPEIPDA